MLEKSKVSFGRWYPHGIIVNKESQGFLDEAEDSSVASTLGQAMLKQTDGIGYAILDEKHKTLVPASLQKRFLENGGTLSEADSIEELAENLGLNPISLKQTVDEFNAAVKEGMALSLHPPITGEAVKLDAPKFYDARLVNGSTLSFGGVRINRKSQIINLEGEVIPGVYAVGILVGGLYYQNYKGGFGLASAVTFGRLAGIYAAQEKLLS
jgi:tricarballylate dehydrogenase